MMNPARQRDINAELSAFGPHVPLKLAPAVGRSPDLAEGSSEAAAEVQDQIRSTLMQIFVRRLILTFEKRPER